MISQNIVVIERDPIISAFICTAIETWGCSVTHYANPEEELILCSELSPNAIIRRAIGAFPHHQPHTTHHSLNFSFASLGISLRSLNFSCFLSALLAYLNQIQANLLIVTIKNILSIKIYTLC